MAGKTVGAALGLVLVAAGALGGVAALGADGEGGAAQRPLRFSPSDLFVEINATDGDAGLQANIGGREWDRLAIRDPSGRTILNITDSGRLRGYGLTDFTFESSEPPFDRVPLRRFNSRFPEGRYTISGTTPEGRRVVGSDRITHNYPAGPNVTAPTEDAVVDPASLVVRWDPVTRPRGIRIALYQVIVTDEATDQELSIDLGPSARQATIAPEFLKPGTEYAVEVLARERGGNQTITEVPFRTSG